MASKDDKQAWVSLVIHTGKLGNIRGSRIAHMSEPHRQDTIYHLRPWSFPVQGARPSQAACNIERTPLCVTVLGFQ